MVVLGLAIALLIGLSATSHPLPAPKPHPLPPTLATWRDPGNSGDYFDQIEPLSVGYLVWSEFPIRVYLEPISQGDRAHPTRQRQAETWVNALQSAVKEWTVYLPLQIVSQSEGADIIVWRSPPPLRLEKPAKTESADRPSLPMTRARSAETRLELYLRTQPGKPAPILAQRFTMHLRPDQAADYLLATARHELGHALGIWGHSPQPTDALYFSQVRHPPSISRRDINTLRRIYEQPTRIGWAIPAPSKP